MSPFDHNDDEHDDDEDQPEEHQHGDHPNGIGDPCCKCHRNPATVQMTIMNESGVVGEKFFCFDCASSFSHFAHGKVAPEKMGELLRELIDLQLLDKIDGKLLEKNDDGLMPFPAEYRDEFGELTTLHCPCGRTLREIKNSSMVGCSSCYEVFAPFMLEHLSFPADGAPEHTGQRPSEGPRVGARTSVTLHLHDLNERLEDALKREDYLLAAQLRDNIRTVQL